MKGRKATLRFKDAIDVSKEHGSKMKMRAKARTHRELTFSRKRIGTNSYNLQRIFQLSRFRFSSQ